MIFKWGSNDFKLLQIVLFGFMNNLLSQFASLNHETHPFGTNAIFCS